MTWNLGIRRGHTEYYQYHGPGFLAGLLYGLPQVNLNMLLVAIQPPVLFCWSRVGDQCTAFECARAESLEIGHWAR